MCRLARAWFVSRSSNRSCSWSIWLVQLFGLRPELHPLQLRMSSFKLSISIFGRKSSAAVRCSVLFNDERLQRSRIEFIEVR